MQQPLAEILRPKSVDEVVGQDHLVGKDGFLTKIIRGKKPLSLIFWGPPGSGKTTLARLYAKAFSAKLVSLSAVFSGVADLKKIIKEAEAYPLFERHTILFVDEIHRFNKSQQDAFLPYLEKGTITLIGATTENPSFALNNALLSRLRVLVLNPLDERALETLIERYEEAEGKLEIDKAILISNAQGDGRYLYNLIENIKQSNSWGKDVIQRRSALFDKKADGHYDLISALHKSVRGSDPDASLYWFCRILEGGEDPLYIARRLIRMAVEDIGLADPQALKLAVAARDAYQMLGTPEGELALAEVVIYLSLAPKSNALYTAYKSARKKAAHTNHLSPPKIILNAPTKLMKDLDYGKNYQYDHDAEDCFSGQNYFPDQLEREEFYQPVDRGFEREIKKRIEYFKNLRMQRPTSDNNDQ